MKTKYFLMVMILFIIISISSVSAQSQGLGIYKQFSSIQLVQNCENSSYSNITRVIYPNSSFALDIQTIMTKNGDNYNYSFSNTLINGEYLVYGNCNPNNISANWAYDFNITPLGQVFDTSKAITYSLIILIGFIIFGLTLWGGIAIPNRKTRDQFTGYVIAVDNIKYFKMFLVAISYLILMLIFYLSWIISMSFLDIDFLAGLFKFGFYFLAIALLPLFIVMVYVVIANWVRDSEVGDMLSRGLHVGGKGREI